jgi:7-cyano-7-deazaguanine reductase
MHLNNPLGMNSKYIEKYDKTLLFPVKRTLAREKMSIDDSFFTGYDIWNSYEVSWLNQNGKPEVGILRLIYPSASENIVESKSLKLYLNSFNMTKFLDRELLLKTIKEDLDELLKTDCKLQMFNSAVDAFKCIEIGESSLIDHLDIDTFTYTPDASLLVVEKGITDECEIFSNLLKTNCPVTGQPDWGTLHIKYVSESHILEDSLLKYIVSYRNAQDFHEACCEKIFNDIYKVLNPQKLFVKCYYTRRGGIDINPLRFVGYKPTDFDFFSKVWRQ